MGKREQCLTRFVCSTGSVFFYEYDWDAGNNTLV